MDRLDLMVWVGGSQGTLAPALVALFRQADALWPDRSEASDGSIGDQSHADRTSDHNPKSPNPPGWVDAADLTEDFANGPNLPALWDHLISTRDSRVKYLIYEGRIVKSYGTQAWQPYPYSGVNAHAQHIHVSVTPEGRGDTSPWFPAPASEEDDMTPEQAQTLAEVHWMLSQVKPNVDRIPAVQASVDLTSWGVLDPGQGLRAMVADLAGRPVAKIDAATIAAAIPADLAEQVADELAKRLAG